MPQFIIIYFGCYLFWVVNYFMASMREEKVKYQFFTADFYARLVCMLCFIFYPTTNTRPVLTGTDIWTHFFPRFGAPPNKENDHEPDPLVRPFGLQYQL